MIPLNDNPGISGLEKRPGFRDHGINSPVESRRVKVVFSVTVCIKEDHFILYWVRLSNSDFLVIKQ